MSQFVHLRVHSVYSVGFGTLPIAFNKKEPDKKNIISFCRDYRMPAVAITDNNLMTASAELSDKSPDEGIQPIVGITITLNHHANAAPGILRAEQMSQIVLLAQNHDGYLNLCKISEIMYMRQDNWHLGAHVTLDELAPHAGGLICLSGGHNGAIGRAILENQERFAAELADRFLSIFGDRFYIELSRFGLSEQIKTEPAFLKLAVDKNIPIVATNDVCFASPPDYEATDALHCILGQTKVIQDGRTRANAEQYFKSPEEMAELFSDLPEAVENTLDIARRCAFMVNVHEKPLLPKFGDNFDEECRMLRDDAIAGLRKRMSENKIAESEQKKYFDQAEFELETIIKMGFPGYFLIVADYIRWAENNDIAVGPGRGSGAGSVVAWSLGITKVDPLKYGLLFERFLNPDRISMPDFDIDFEPDKIDQIIDYIQNKYGADHICRIITFGSLQARGAIRDVGRVFGIPYSKSDRFAKMIPQDAKKLKQALNDRGIKEALEEDPDMRKVVEIAGELEGSYRNLGQHACGFVIGDHPITKIAPVYRDPSNSVPSSQFDGHYLESSGLIKFDFLLLETLTVVKRAIKMIRENHGVDINSELIPLEDEAVYKTIWQNGRTLGVFQFDAPHMQRYLQAMKPTCFANIVALNALNRPGPAAFIPNYIARMHGEEKVSYPHPLAEDVLKETYGILVYQEQVMQLSRVLAGYTRGESDSLRKAMGKKIKELMEQHHKKFVDGCVANKTLAEQEAEELYGQFEKFAEYAFNKSHSLCYAVVANQCAWLKAHYPAEFIAADMGSKLNDTDYLAEDMRDARNNFNVDVAPPNINESDSLFSVRNGKIIFGLAAIKGIGRAVTDVIVKERNENGKFRNLTDFAKRTAGVINKRVLENFIKAGVLDSFCPDRAKLYYNADAILLYAGRQKEGAQTLSLFENTTEDDVTGDNLAKDLARSQSWGFNEQLAMETEALGFSLRSSRLDPYKKLIDSQKLLKCGELSNQGDRKSVRIAMNVIGYSRRTTKTGRPMMVVKGTDGKTNIDTVAFGDGVFELEGVLREHETVVIAGRTAVREDNSVSLFIDTIVPIDEWAAMSAKKITLSILDRARLADLKEIIDALPNGLGKITMKISDGEKEAVLALPRGVRLMPDTMARVSEMGIKVEIE
ncbi:MAG: DNA polymerase III subunit alpha [Rickettsiales bacterium]|jgi:DNA polymerase-3 subunit alpha|nr:DNA polymerase III subunit alpha [Rickettsiales bacterium]